MSLSPFCRVLRQFVSVLALFSVAMGDDVPMGKRSARTSFGNVGTRVAEDPIGRRRPSHLAEAAKQADAPTVKPNAPQLLVTPFDQTTARKGQEAWAADLKTPSENTNSIGMKLRLIPPGEYLMGSTKVQIEKVLSWSPLRNPMIAREQPAHRVRIVRPYLGVHEVTRGEFAKYVAATGYKTGTVGVPTKNSKGPSDRTSTGGIQDIRKLIATPSSM
jgi:formylglycine-generating enzyme required for sulfatase activity